MPILLFGFIHLHYIIMYAFSNIVQEIMQFDFSCTFPSAFSISINSVWKISATDWNNIKKLN